MQKTSMPLLRRTTTRCGQSSAAIQVATKGSTPTPTTSHWQIRLGGIARGRAEVEQRLERAAANFRDGEIVGFDTITRLVTPELAYLLEVERSNTKVGGSNEVTRTDIRVTTVFRPEGGAWKVVHRHADPAVDAKQADTAFQR